MILNTATPTLPHRLDYNTNTERAERKLLVYIRIAVKILKTNICCTTHPKRLIKIPTVVMESILISSLRNPPENRKTSPENFARLLGGVKLRFWGLRDPDDYEGGTFNDRLSVSSNWIVMEAHHLLRLPPFLLKKPSKKSQKSSMCTVKTHKNVQHYRGTRNLFYVSFRFYLLKLKTWSERRALGEWRRKKKTYTNLIDNLCVLHFEVEERFMHLYNGFSLFSATCIAGQHSSRRLCFWLVEFMPHNHMWNEQQQEKSF